MQEWMIAMLVISIMPTDIRTWQNYFSRKSAGYRRTAVLQEGHPQKERVEKYAASFRNWQILLRDALSERLSEQQAG